MVKVEINYKLPYVAVGNKFFAQGEDAQEIIDMGEKYAKRHNTTTEKGIVMYLRSAGAI